MTLLTFVLTFAPAFNQGQNEPEAGRLIAAFILGMGIKSILDWIMYRD